MKLEKAFVNSGMCVSALGCVQRKTGKSAKNPSNNFNRSRVFVVQTQLQVLLSTDKLREKAREERVCVALCFSRESLHIKLNTINSDNNTYTMDVASSNKPAAKV